MRFIAAACIVTSAALPALAGETVRARAPALPADCAMHGPGFAKVSGTDTCVKIGGHVRVEYGIGSRNLNWAGQSGGGTASGLTQYAPQTLAPLPAGDAHFDSRTPTGTGEVRTYMRLRSGSFGQPSTNPALR